MVEVGVRGVRNTLIELGMVEGKLRRPVYQARVDRTRWIRAEFGGLLQFHVAPGAVVAAGQPLATNTDLLGRERNVLAAPHDGVILGMSTLPSVTPGDAVCHIAIPTEGIAPIREALANVSKKSLHERLRGHLASNVSVSVREPDAGPEIDA